MFKKFYVFIAAALLAALSAGSSYAESFDYRFDVKLGIAKIGEMQVAANNNGSGYSAGVMLVTTGVVGALYDVQYDFSASGRVGAGGVLIPARHRSFSDEQGRISTLNISYSGDRVASVAYDPFKSVPANVTTFRGTIDPTTLIYFLLRPVKSADACSGRAKLFDGGKRSTVTFKNTRRFSDGRVECDIAYSSVSGGGGIALSALVFVSGNDGMVEIKEFSAQTNIGTLAVKRR